MPGKTSLQGLGKLNNHYNPHFIISILDEINQISMMLG
jgi:hypothetical protein